MAFRRKRRKTRLWAGAEKAPLTGRGFRNAGRASACVEKEGSCVVPSQNPYSARSTIASLGSSPVRVIDRTRIARDGSNDAMITRLVPFRHWTEKKSPASAAPGTAYIGPVIIDAWVAT